MNSHSVYGDAVHDWELNDNGGASEFCFLTHSLKEELDEVNKSAVFSVSPVQRIRGNGYDFTPGPDEFFQFEHLHFYLLHCV